jgi:phosphoglycolate phosphatase
MKYDRIIWDFNGTILDDVQVGINSANELLTRYGLKKIKDVDHYHSIFGFPIKSYYERLGFDFNVLDYNVLAHEWVEIYLRLVEDAPIRNGVLDVIKQIEALNIKQTILSMTEQNMLSSQVMHLGIDGYFDEILGKSDVYAYSKAELAAKWRDEHVSERVLYVGDTTHDAESAMIIGCECLLLDGGHESRETLLKSGVEVISSPDSILSLIM